MEKQRFENSSDESKSSFDLNISSTLINLDGFIENGNKNKEIEVDLKYETEK